MQGFIRSFIFGLAVVLILIQFIQPARTNPAISPSRTLESAVAVPPDVEAILTRACQDCHSDLTVWPWYSKIAPISWYIVDHVNDGRRDLNFSEWLRPSVSDPMEYTRQKFHTACREIRLGHMPLYSYVLLHRQARLTPEDGDTICQWANVGLSKK